MIFLVSCEQPRTNSRRATTTSTQNGTTTIIYQDTSSSSTIKSSSGSEESNNSGSDSSTDYDTSNTSLIGENSYNENCAWSEDGVSNFANSHELIGEYSLCQSTVEENKIYFQLKTPSYNGAVCFFPVTSENEAITYLGNATCVNALQSNQIYAVQLYKDRNGFSHYPMTGLIVVLDQVYYYNTPFNATIPAPTAFTSCMDHIATTFAYYGVADTSYCEAFSAANSHFYHSF